MLTEEQEQLARLIHHFRADHSDEQYAVRINFKVVSLQLNLLEIVELESSSNMWVKA